MLESHQKSGCRSVNGSKGVFAVLFLYLNIIFHHIQIEIGEEKLQYFWQISHRMIVLYFTDDNWANMLQKLNL